MQRTSGGSSGSRKKDQRLQVVIIGPAQGVDVALAQFTRCLKVPAAPAERLAAELFNEQVRHQAGVAAVAIGKSVHEYDLMMEPYREFVRVERPVFNPVPELLEQLRGLAVDLPGRSSNTLKLYLAILTCPSLDFPEHPFVKAARKRICRNIKRLWPFAFCPGKTACNVIFLRDVEVPAALDPGRNQLLLIVGRDRRGALYGRENVGHTSLQRSRSLISFRM